VSTKLHWVEGPWLGKLALAARPRGDDWLEDEIAAWHVDGIDVVVSLLTPDEGQDLDLGREAQVVKARGMKFVSFPIPDRQVPNSETEMAAALERIDAELSAGRNVVVHCRQGIGRTGLVGACLLITKGLSSERAVKAVSAVRGNPVPETEEQRRWIDHYAAILAGTK
jgi:protein tyrosine/serine phosphatase